MRVPDSYLSRREQQLIEILYRFGPISANEILARLPDSPSNSTVRKLLTILEEKGHVSHEEVDGKFLYSPTHAREEAGRGVLRDAMQTFFAGSMTKTVAALLTGGEKLSEHELAHLEELIRKAKEEQR
ncbi:MAG: BlaI/MecI/CopY family transcriptional regulator [Fimbriimonas sp.]|nr:BlaI/MecI/CopY family transcriptional regulator [Fimbriimonas sp.]